MAVAASPENWIVAALLPMPKEVYRSDFRFPELGVDRSHEFDDALMRAETVTELPFDRDRPAAYARAGHLMLAQVDLLVAVWDGEAARGMGGTGEIVAAAHRAEIPVLWIRPDGDDVLLLTKEDRRDALNGPLQAAVREIIKPPLPLETYPKRTGWVAYDALLRLANSERPRRVIKLGGEPHGWEAFGAAVPEGGPLGERLHTILKPRLVEADTLAERNAHRYRSAYVIAYLLALVAVLLALGGILAESVDVKAALVAAELAVLGAIFWLIRRGREERWHEKWMEHRLLAEILRHLSFLAYLGASAPARSPQTPDWVMRHLRDTSRTLGLPHATLDEDYRSTLLEAVRTHVVEDQINYHANNVKRLRRLEHLLHGVGFASFLVAVAALGLWFAVYLLDLVGLADVYGPLKATKVPLGLLAAAAPALGSACAGISFTGSYSEFKQRSQRTAARLQHVTLDPSTFEATAASLREVAAVLLEDLGAWADIYRGKGLNLPG
ncbi:MAG: hypothetical protein QNJ16_03630 [Rhodobacter sp.]|nr:hypothetical protein [Rhodobacter sp.]